MLKKITLEKQFTRSNLHFHLSYLRKKNYAKSYGFNIKSCIDLKKKNRGYFSSM